MDKVSQLVQKIDEFDRFGDELAALEDQRRKTKNKDKPMNVQLTEQVAQKRIAYYRMALEISEAYDKLSSQEQDAFGSSTTTGKALKSAIRTAKQAKSAKIWENILDMFIPGYSSRNDVEAYGGEVKSAVSNVIQTASSQMSKYKEITDALSRAREHYDELYQQQISRNAAALPGTSPVRRAYIEDKLEQRVKNQLDTVRGLEQQQYNHEVLTNLRNMASQSSLTDAVSQSGTPSRTLNSVATEDLLSGIQKLEKGVNN